MTECVWNDSIAGFRSPGAFKLLRRQRRAHAGGGQHRNQVSNFFITAEILLIRIHNLF